MKNFGATTLIAGLAAFAMSPVQAQDGVGELEQGRALLEQNEDMDEEEAEQAALALFEASCAAGNAQGCFEAGDLLDSISMSDEEDDRALELLEKSCASDVAEGCEKAGGLIAGGEGDEAEFARGMAMLAKGCDLGFGPACENAGDLLSSKPEQRSEALAFFVRACDLDRSSACNSAGFMHQSGRGTERSHPVARAFYERGCDMGNGNACFAGGESAFHDRNIDGREMARSFYERLLAIRPDHPNGLQRMAQIEAETN